MIEQISNKTNEWEGESVQVDERAGEEKTKLCKKNEETKPTDNTGKWGSRAKWRLRSIFNATQFLDAIFSFSQQIVQMVSQWIGRFN